MISLKFKLDCACMNGWISSICLNSTNSSAISNLYPCIALLAPTLAPRVAGNVVRRIRWPVVANECYKVVALGATASCVVHNSARVVSKHITFARNVDWDWSALYKGLQCGWIVSGAVPYTTWTYNTAAISTRSNIASIGIGVFKLQRLTHTVVECFVNVTEIAALVAHRKRTIDDLLFWQT